MRTANTPWRGKLSCVQDAIVCFPTYQVNRLVLAGPWHARPCLLAPCQGTRKRGMLRPSKRKATDDGRTTAEGGRLACTFLVLTLVEQALRVRQSIRSPGCYSRSTGAS